MEKDAVVGGGINAKKAIEVLATEIKTYQKEKERLLSRPGPCFVLIKGEEVIGTYRAEEDAFDVAFNRFGNEPFLVKEVIRDEAAVVFSNSNIE